MSPKSEQVERELLAIGFRAYPRGLLNGFVFACLTIWLMWPRMPHQLLGGWFAGFATIALCRLAIARAFHVVYARDAESRPEARQFVEWVQREIRKDQ